MTLPSASVFATGILVLWLDFQLRWHARCSVEHKNRVAYSQDKRVRVRVCFRSILLCLILN